MKIINYLIVLDLIFGGSGRLIMLGPVSIRTILFGIAMLYTIGYSLFFQIRFNGKHFLLITGFVVYLIFNVVLVGDKPFSVKSDFLTRYLYIVLVFFYEIFFARNSISDMRQLIERTTFIFAIFSILLWIYALYLGNGAYNVIEYGFFRPKVYGNFDFIAGRIPRIFMKSSIFVPIGLMFQIDRYLEAPKTVSLVKCGIYAIAIVTTFTAGFFLATAVCCVLLLNKRRVFKKQIGFIILLVGIAGAIAVLRFGLIEIMTGRYTGDYSSNYRLIQLKSILDAFSQKPIFGHGFGYEFTTVYGNTVRTTPNFEIAWGETLVDTGIIGFSLFVSIVFITFHKLLKRSATDKIYYTFAMGLLVIFLESLTNPFINNSIGLTYFAICTGLVYNTETKEKALGSESLQG